MVVPHSLDGTHEIRADARVYQVQVPLVPLVRLAHALQSTVDHQAVGRRVLSAATERANVLLPLPLVMMRRGGVVLADLLRAFALPTPLQTSSEAGMEQCWVAVPDDGNE